MPSDPPQLRTELFSDTFHNRSGQTTNNWTDATSAFSNFDGRMLVPVNAGELIYNGDTLHSLAGTTGEDADFYVTAKCRGAENMKFTLRARRTDASNFIGLSLNWETNIIKLVKTSAGVETTLSWTSHGLKFNGRYYYNVALSMRGTKLHAFVNGFEILTANDPTHRTKDGFSIYMPSVNADDPGAFGWVQVRKTQLFPPETLSDHDLWVFFRRLMKEEVENPAERTWESFKRAHLHYVKNKDMGHRQQTWNRLGYPLKRPSGEEWFG